LANDDLGDDPLIGDQPVAVTIVAQPPNGTAGANGDNTVTYTPDPDWFSPLGAPDIFIYLVTDADGDTDTATVAVTVNPVDDVPDAVDDIATAVEDTIVLIPVLTNDTGLGDAPIALTVFGSPLNGTAVVVGNQIRYSPDVDFNGSDSFAYRVEDADLDFDTAAVSMTVTSVNDNPVAVDDGAAQGALTDEDTPVDIDVLANDSDIDLPPQTLLVIGVTDPPNGSAVITGGGTGVRYTPDPDQFGADGFSYTISDGAGGTDTAAVSVTVNSVNDVPEANNDLSTTPEDDSTGVLISVLANDSGLGDVPLSLSVESPPAHGTAVIVGSQIRYTVTEPNYSGPDAFIYRVTDVDGDFDVASVDVSVTPVNDDPLAVDDSASTLEDASVDIAVLTNDTDVDGPGPLSVIGVSTPSNGTAAIIGGGSAVRYTPDPDTNGSDAFTYTLSDGAGGTDTGFVDVGVTPVNDAPAATDDAYSTNEDTTLIVSAPGVLSNDSDIDLPPDTLTAALVSGPSSGTLGLNPDGSFTYTPALDFYGSATFAYRAYDGSAYSYTATVTITVNPIPPEIIVDKSSQQSSVLVGDTIRFTIAWANLGPGTATGVVLDDSLTGPCTLIAPSPSFPFVIGSVLEGDGGFIDVYARADDVGTCSNTASLHSDRWDPPSSSSDVDISPLSSTVGTGPSFAVAGAPLLLIILAPPLFRRRRSRGRSGAGRGAPSQGPSGPAG
jgi:uncharacterized repeat protein (TIGR01451 family)